MLHYKRPAFGIIVVSVVALLIASVSLLKAPHGGTGSAGAAYLYTNGSGCDKASLTIDKESKEFNFCFSMLSSYRVQGKYQEIDDGIVCKTDDGENAYTFRKNSNGALVFMADRSSQMPSYAYASGAEPEICVPDGALFAAAPMQN